MPSKIIQRNNPVLREKSIDVPPEEINSERIKNIIANMKEAMHEEEDAVAIAAPQIGVLLKIFIVAGKVFKKKAEGEEKTEKDPPDAVFINPKITRLSKKSKSMEEGCLSVRYLYGRVNRSTKATVEALDENGKKISRGASGLLAQIFQHETDHLKGVLFVDKAQNIIEIPPEKKEEIKKARKKTEF